MPYKDPEKNKEYNRKYPEQYRNCWPWAIADYNSLLGEGNRMWNW